MVDETTDISTKEQVVIVFRWVDNDLDVHEEFVGLYSTDSIASDPLVAIIKDVLLRLNLKLKNCRGQCYDGASNMKGCRTGVATQIQAAEPRAIYTHCYGHALNLACQDTIRDVKVVKDALDTTFEISKLLKYSSKRNAAFLKVKENIAPADPGFRTLCPARWTVRADSLASVRMNYSVLQNSWDIFSQMATRDLEMSARVNGIAAQLSKFDFLFGVMLGEKVLRLADNLSTTLQNKKLSAVEGQHAASLTCDSLAALRTDIEFQKFWILVKTKAADVDADEPSLPRKRRVPARYEGGHGVSYHPPTVEDHYRHLYFQAIDHIVSSIKERFDQPGYQVYSNLEKLLHNAAAGHDYKSELETISRLYGGDFDFSLVNTQLHILKTKFSSQQADTTHDSHSDCVSGKVSFSAVKNFITSLGDSSSLLSEVVKLVQLILVMPAKNATSERSFSALKRVKTFLQGTMKQSRLNHLMILHVHKEIADKFDLVACANDFVAANEHRSKIFGHFSCT